MSPLVLRLGTPSMYAHKGNTALRRGSAGRRFGKIFFCKYELCIYLAPTRWLLAPESVISLPPLDSLRFFEATARHQSFALAGKELGVTAAAASSSPTGNACRGAPSTRSRSRLPEMRQVSPRPPPGPRSGCGPPSRDGVRRRRQCAPGSTAPPRSPAPCPRRAPGPRRSGTRAGAPCCRRTRARCSRPA